MADQTTVPNLEFIRLGSKSVPTIRLAEPSAAGSTSLVFDSAITQEDNSTAIAKAMLLGFKVGGKVLVVYVAAGGFTSTTAATITTRPVLRGGLDITTAGATTEDFDLPAGTKVYAVVSAFHGEFFNQAQQGAIGQGLKLKERPTYRDTGINADRVFADATARDAAITSPANGDRCYNTATGTFQKYQGGAWANDATGTTVNATATVAGKVELATSAESQTAASDTGGSGASLSVLPSDIAANTQNSQHSFAADAEASDTYAITLAPAIADYATGQRFIFTANTANTGAATLNVNAKGAKNILKFNDQALETGDIEAGQVVEVVYDGTSMQMVSQIASQMSTANSTTLTDASDASALHVHPTQEITRKFDALDVNVSATSDTEVIAHGLGGTPNWARLFCTMTEATAEVGSIQNIVSMGMSDGAGDDSCSWTGTQDTGGNTADIAGSSSTKSIYLAFRETTSDETIQGVATFDGTNLTLTFTNSDASAQNIHVQWEVGY